MKDITPFSKVYDLFLGKITDDLYMELTEEETMQDLQNILLTSITSFEFPRVPIFDYELDHEIEPEDEELLSEEEEVGPKTIAYFNCILSLEEIDILSDLMMSDWMNRQIMSVDNTRMKYSGSDFKFTSQANHLDKLVKSKEYYDMLGKRKQRMYKRRTIGADGMVKTNYGGLAGGALK